MPARRMRVELFDSDGNRYSISFEGQITRDKAVRLLDLVELLGGVPGVGAANPSSPPASVGGQASKFDRLRTLIQKHFPLVWFSSREVQTAFEHEFKQPIALSTVATYLARMTTKGLILRSGPPNSLKYKFVFSGSRPPIEQPLL